ncbi:protein turtle homolog B [Lethenteron reissneri]|uniref:protein turtle homolog B n=1 Tax=Lethenteron reissneri TaxID=7753 RepID=UPI002AB60AFE|nr:protein turtle homolog B [Lethenteron reissneri]
MDARLPGARLLLFLLTLPESLPDLQGRSGDVGRGRQVVARAGDTVILGCDVSHGGLGRPPPYVIEWYKNEIPFPLLIQFGSYPPRIDPAYAGRVSLYEMGSLRMETVQAEDSGWYECNVLFLDKQYDPFANGTRTYLAVRAPPRFRDTPPPYMEVRQGSEVTLACSAYGRPEPIVGWRKDGRRLPNGAKYQVLNGKLTIPNADRSDNGIYACWASSNQGESIHITRLLVQGSPVIVLPPRNVTANITQHALFSCRAEAYPSNVTYSWFKADKNVHAVSGLEGRVRVLLDGSLLIYRASPNDAGAYSCVASNGLGNAATASAHLTIHYPARVVGMPAVTYVPIGLAGFVRCPADAVPPVLRIDWKRDGRPLDLQAMPGWSQRADGALVIPEVSKAALGSYSCTPYNAYGSVGESASTQLILKPPPYFTLVPAREYKQEVGRELRIPCSAVGDPPPSYSWRQEGHLLPQQPPARDGTLYIRALHKEDSGRWACVASNVVTSISADTYLYVTGTTPHSARDLHASSALDSANLSWAPGYDGGYAQHFTVWVKRLDRRPSYWDPLPVPAAHSEITVGDLEPGKFYQFSVLAHNQMGSGPFSSILTVRTQSPYATTAEPHVRAGFNSATLPPPRCLTANQTESALLLAWLPPLNQSEAAFNYSVESRHRWAGWEEVETVAGSHTQVELRGLLKTTWYEFRVLVVADDGISEPTNTVTVWMAGALSPTRPALEVPQPILAGVIAGICFLAIAVLFSTVAACLISRQRRSQRPVPHLSITHCKKRTESESSLDKANGADRTRAGSRESRTGLETDDDDNDQEPFGEAMGAAAAAVASADGYARTEGAGGPGDGRHAGGPKLSLYEKLTRGSGHGRYSVSKHERDARPIELISRGPDGRFTVDGEEVEEVPPSRRAETQDERSPRSERRIRGFPFVRDMEMYPEFQHSDMEGEAAAAMGGPPRGSQFGREVSGTSSRSPYAHHADAGRSKGMEARHPRGQGEDSRFLYGIGAQRQPESEVIGMLEGPLPMPIRQRRAAHEPGHGHGHGHGGVGRPSEGFESAVPILHVESRQRSFSPGQWRKLVLSISSAGTSPDLSCSHQAPSSLLVYPRSPTRSPAGFSVSPSRSALGYSSSLSRAAAGYPASPTRGAAAGYPAGPPRSPAGYAVASSPPRTPAPRSLAPRRTATAYSVSPPQYYSVSGWEETRSGGGTSPSGDIKARLNVPPNYEDLVHLEPPSPRLQRSPRSGPSSSVSYSGTQPELRAGIRMSTAMPPRDIRMGREDIPSAIAALGPSSAMSHGPQPFSGPEYSAPPPYRPPRFHPPALAPRSEPGGAGAVAAAAGKSRTEPREFSASPKGDVLPGTSTSEGSAGVGSSSVGASPRSTRRPEARAASSTRTEDSTPEEEDEGLKEGASAFRRKSRSEDPGDAGDAPGQLKPAAPGGGTPRKSSLI